MGRHSGTETAFVLVLAFMRQRTWKQADLARETGLQTKSLRVRLDELAEHIPLEREEDHPHVYWSVPPKWMPHGLELTPEEVADLLRVLQRLPKSKLRTHLLNRVLQGTAQRQSRTDRPPAVLVPSLPPEEERWLATIEDAANARVALTILYKSAKEQPAEQRVVSPQRLLVGPPGRLLAECHRSGKLKWFRLVRMKSVTLLGRAEFRPRDAREVETALRLSINGFRSEGAGVDIAFHVRNPEARWAADNLPTLLAHEPAEDGIRVFGHTAALPIVARFVVGLGAAARVESSGPLRDLVCELARASLDANQDAIPPTEQRASRRVRKGA